jgi:hypothetical protein
MNCALYPVSSSDIGAGDGYGYEINAPGRGFRVEAMRFHESVRSMCHAGGLAARDRLLGQALSPMARPNLDKCECGNIAFGRLRAGRLWTLGDDINFARVRLPVAGQNYTAPVDKEASGGILALPPRRGLALGSALFVSCLIQRPPSNSYRFALLFNLVGEAQELS